jgi:glycosyltransferase involved in cell wall biosynthesis
VSDAAPGKETPLDLSIVVPIYDEESNIPILYREFVTVLTQLGKSFEILFINDGSHDGSLGRLTELAKEDSRIKVISFGRNFGQTAAMSAGFQFASGEIVLPFDGDLQNDPADIPKILDKLAEGYDVVSCWRRDRKDRWLSRKIPSILANRLISLVSGVHLHDYGCTLKAYRKEILKHVRLYGEMHRFIPIYAFWAGAKVTEIAVNHRPRRFGKSKYGLMRTMKVLLDLITVRFLGSYSTKPMYLFGGIGTFLCLGGFVFGALTLYQKFADAVKAHRNPLLLLAVFLFILGIQFILIGLVAELLIRIYYESQSKSVFIVRETWNINEEKKKGSYEKV